MSMLDSIAKIKRHLYDGSNSKAGFLGYRLREVLNINIEKLRFINRSEKLEGSSILHISRRCQRMRRKLGKGLHLIIAAGPIFILALSVSACSSFGKKTDITKHQFDQQLLLNKSSDYALQMTKGDFETISSSFSEKMKKALDAEKLKATWQQVTIDLGAYKSVREKNYSEKGGLATITVILDYENNGLILVFSYDENNNIAGLWLNYAPFSLELTNNETLIESSILVGSGDIKMNGILTVPKEGDKFPVVVLVQGSGQSDMNETIGTASNRPFKDIAQGLAARGIASIRYNKRYFQYPDQAGEQITIHDEVLDDVKAAIELAAGNEHFSKIIVVGHSMGAMMAPKIAKDNPEVKALVSLAGSPRKLQELILDQNKEAIASMAEKSQEEKDALFAQVKAQVEQINNLSADDKITKVFGVKASYWSSLNEIDTAKIAEELTIPMLFMQGGADFQVYADIDFKAWQNILGDKQGVEFKLYEDLNHLFMPTKGIRDITEYNSPNNVDQRVIDDLSAWINMISI